jgi:GntR family transcriptional regulator
MEKGASTLYHQLARKLRERIISGMYSPGATIPTEPQLCEEFGMSRITVRQAVSILENEGMVQRQQGRGTFVRELNRQSLGWNFGSVEDLVYLAKQSHLELTAKRKIKAPEKIAHDLELPTHSPIYYFKGIRHIRDFKASYRSYVIESIGRKMQIKTIENQVLFAEVENITRERIKFASQFIYARQAEKEIAKEIGIKVGSALLVTKRIYRSEMDVPLMVAITQFPGNVYQSIAVLERN